MHNCVKVNSDMLLIDGYAKYTAANELRLKEVMIEVITEI